MDYPLTIALDRPDCRVAIGAMAQLALHLTNGASESRRFHIEVEGPPPECLDLGPAGKAGLRLAADAPD